MCSLLLLLLGAVPAGAQTAAPSSYAALRSSFVYTGERPLTVERILAHMEKMDGLLLSLKARYAQEMRVPETGMRSSVEGDVAFKKPERLRIAHERPEKQIIVADGVDIWIHRPAHDQVIQSKLQDWKDADPTMNNLMQFGSYGKMLRAYDVSLAKGEEPALELRPKKNDARGTFALRLGLDPETLFPASAALSVGAMTITTRFSGVTFNPDIDDATFVFTPPKDADVFRNFKPPRLQP